MPIYVSPPSSEVVSNPTSLGDAAWDYLPQYIPDADGLSDGSYFTIKTQGSNGTAAIDAGTGAWTFTPKIGRASCRERV